MDLGIEGKCALVLAAGGGLGRAIAVAMAREGAALAVVDLDEVALAETLAEVQASGAKAVAGAADLMDLAGLDSFVSRVDRELGGVDILVNISGGPPPTTAANVSPQNWLKQFQAMVVSMIYVTDLVLPGRVRPSLKSSSAALILFPCTATANRKSLPMRSHFLRVKKHRILREQCF